MAAATDQPISGGPDPEPGLREPSRSLWRGLISLGILVAIVVGLLLAVPGLHGVAEKVSDMSGGWLIVAVGLEILSCVGYILAFLQVFDRAPVRFGARVALSELAFGAAVSLGGAGSVAVGAWLLVDRGAPPGRIAERSAVLFLLTSAINVITLALAGLALWTGLLPGPSNPLLSVVPAAVGVVVLVGVMLLPRMTERLAAGREPGRVRLLLNETATTIRLTERVLFSSDWRTIGAIAYLWCDIGVLAACFAAAGTVPPLAPLVLAYQIGYLSNLVPVPGNIGVLDGSLIGMLVIYGATATVSTAATVVYHAIALWIPAVWGTVSFLILRRSRGRPLQLRPPREERRALRRRRG
ncbi:MAG TPA: lysylphosphatidylglycerol synthase transmembrane domain-containing protein [Solirubrobacteraceae bacterium]|nr:lysylphosphatidylglycerol synthase transmembrane domain-containing protein [Solirubrobacteraceae bacterium]